MANRKYQHGLATADWFLFNTANPRIVVGPFRPIQRTIVLQLVDILEDITAVGHWDYGTARFHSEALGEYLSQDKPSGPPNGPSAGLELAEPSLESWLSDHANDNQDLLTEDPWDPNSATD